MSFTLFLLAINNLDEEIIPLVIAGKYSDDITILCKGKKIKDTHRAVNKPHLNSQPRKQNVNCSPKKKELKKNIHAKTGEGTRELK